MNSFLTVNNNVNLSLISVTIAPSTYIASFIILIVFLALYIPRLSLSPPRWASFAIPPYLRSLSSSLSSSTSSPTNFTDGKGKALPSLPRDDRLLDYYYRDQDSGLILQDQSLVLSSPDLVKYDLHRHRSSQQSRRQQQQQQQRQQGSHRSDSHERDIRRARRLPPGLRNAPQPGLSAALLGSQRSGDDRARRRGRAEIPSSSPSSPPQQQQQQQGSLGRGGGGGGDGSPGIGDRFRRWVFAPGMAETRQRRSQQRVLERTR